MGSISICLSTASILRCNSLTKNQNIYLIIPTVLEVIFSTSLAFIDQGPGKWVARSLSFWIACWRVHRRNLLVTAEGLSFLTLAVLELVLPAVQGNLHSFNAFDLGIGESNRSRFICSRTHSSIMFRHCFHSTDRLVHNLSLSYNKRRNYQHSPTPH